MNQRCPIQVGPVLTCCHWDPNVRDGGWGEWPSGVRLSVCQFLFILPSKGMNRSMDGFFFLSASNKLNGLKLC